MLGLLHLSLFRRRPLFLLLGGRFLNSTVAVLITLGGSLALGRGLLGRISRRSVGSIRVRVRRATTAVLKIRWDILSQLALRVAVEGASGGSGLITSQLGEFFVVDLFLVLVSFCRVVGGTFGRVRMMGLLYW